MLSLLGADDAMVPVFESLDRYGVIARYFPEWDAVRSRPQRNAFHRFTVDRHLLECVAQAGVLARQVARPDLLLLGALLHDLGKGFPGDHTDAGVEVGPACRRAHGTLGARRTRRGRARPAPPAAARGGHQPRPDRPRDRGIRRRGGGQRRVSRAARGADRGRFDRHRRDGVELVEGRVAPCPGRAGAGGAPRRAAPGGRHRERRGRRARRRGRGAASSSRPTVRRFTSWLRTVPGSSRPWWGCS